MPELPEVETVMRGLRPFCEGCKIIKIDIRSPSLRIPIPRRKMASVCNVRISKVSRRAKYILVMFENEKVMVVHLGMTGSLTVFPQGQHHKINMDRHDHIVFTTDADDVIIYRDPRRFGLIDIVNKNDLLVYKPFLNLGPEPLEKSFTAKVLKEKLQSRTLPIKQAIMDQKIVVGVGNIYASEALFLSGIDPRAAADDLNLSQLETLVDKIKFILKKAIKSGGSTLRDYRRVGGERGYFQFEFAVYDREGMACPGCSCSLKRTGGIQRIVQGGRSTFFCAIRQKDGRK